MHYSAINEALRVRVGLQKLYPYQSQKHLTTESGPVAGLFSGGDDIRLKAGMSNLNAVLTYLHEVAHLIADRANIGDTPDSRSHNPYFAVLLAVMYRRAGLLDHLSIYEFADKGERVNGEGALPDDRVLIRRFRYVLRRSAQLAALPHSIEAIAALLLKEDVLPLWQGASQSKAKPARQWGVWWCGVAAGALTMAAGVLVVLW